MSLYFKLLSLTGGGTFLKRDLVCICVMDVVSLQKKANILRQHIISMVSKAGSGHPGGALGMADVMSVLYFDVMKYKPKFPQWIGRDYFILSNAHTCPVLYACLAEAGFFKKEELLSLRKLGSRLQGHPHVGSLPGIETTGGPLGQGISQAVGLAAILKRENKSNRVFCYVGDGELEEGQCFEAALFAQKEELDNLIVIVDRNNIQIDGNTEDVLHLGDVVSKFRAFDFRVIEFDANNLFQVKHAFKEGLKMKGKPLCFVANSIPGKGVSFMEKDFHWHGKAPSSEEATDALEELRNAYKLIGKKRGDVK